MLVRRVVGFCIRFGIRLRFGTVDIFLRLLLIQIALYGIENAVDELRSFVGGKSAGYFQGFVDGHGARSRFVKKLVDSQAENVAIDYRHTRDTPVFRA